MKPSAAAAIRGSNRYIFYNQTFMREVRRQTGNHWAGISVMAHEVGIKQVVVVVNKMDMVGYDQAVYDKIEKEYREFLGGLGVNPMAFLPISAREGDNVAENTDNLKWFNRYGATAAEIGRFAASGTGVAHLRIGCCTIDRRGTAPSRRPGRQR